MKKAIILIAIFLFLVFVISIPIMEEQYHIQKDPHYLDNRYEFKNGFQPTREY